MVKKRCHFCRNSVTALGLLTLLSFSAQAQKTATVLPKGVFRFRVVNAVGGMNNRLDAQGQTTGLSSKLSGKVNVYSQMEAENPDVAQLQAGLNQIQEGLGNSLFDVNLHSNTSVDFQEHHLALEYGLTPKLSVGLILPISRRQITTSFKATHNVAQTKAQVPEAYAPLAENVETTGAYMSTQAMEQAIFLNNGYQAPRDFKVAGLGDLELGLKYQAFENPRFRTALTGGFRLPTATHKADWSNVLDRSLGDEQWDIVFENSNEYNVMPSLILGAAVRYTVQLPSQQTRPLLRQGEAGPLPNLNAGGTFQTVDRDLGDYAQAEVSLDKTWFRDWNTALIYQHDYKFRDRYKVPSGFQAADLEADTQTQVQRLEVALGYSTLKAYAAKQAFAPLELKLAYNAVLAGENINRNNFGRLDLIVYF